MKGSVGNMPAGCNGCSVRYGIDLTYILQYGDLSFVKASSEGYDIEHRRS